MKLPITTLMQDASLRKAMGQRIKQLRKDKSWTQKELAREIDASPAQLNKYESGLNTPPLDRLAALAEVLGSSVDYLVCGHRSEDLPIRSQRLIQRFRSIEAFEADEREIVIKVLDAMIAKNRMQDTVKALES